MNRPPEQIELDRTPTPQEEADEFSTADEKADQRQKSHELALLEKNMGVMGKLIGAEFAARNIAMLVLIMSFILMGLVFYHAFDPTTKTLSEGVGAFLALLVSIVTGCLGYIFGSKRD